MTSIDFRGLCMHPYFFPPHKIFTLLEERITTSCPWYPMCLDNLLIRSSSAAKTFMVQKTAGGWKYESSCPDCIGPLTSQVGPLISASDAGPFHLDKVILCPYPPFFFKGAQLFSFQPTYSSTSVFQKSSLEGRKSPASPRLSPSTSAEQQTFIGIPFLCHSEREREFKICIQELSLFFFYSSHVYSRSLQANDLSQPSTFVHHSALDIQAWKKTAFIQTVLNALFT